MQGILARQAGNTQPAVHAAGALGVKVADEPRGLNVGRAVHLALGLGVYFQQGTTDCAGIFFLGNVIIAVGIALQLGMGVRGNNVFSQLLQPVRLRSAVRVQGLSGLGGGVGASQNVFL